MAEVNHREPPRGLPLEDCQSNGPDCSGPTAYWWGRGTMPLCTRCAHSLSNAQAYDLAKAEGFGPLPATRPED